jgi:ElaB/YqjD/DUF883 family membrane-anchored ribosome-binding protein
MSEGNGVSTGLSQESFAGAFDSLQSAILSEWPIVDGERLKETAGDLEKVIELVAEATEHTRTLVRKQLAELSTLDGPKKKSSVSAAREKASDMLDRLEKRTNELVKELRGTVLVNAKAKVRENVFVTIFAALGIGLLLGFLFGGMRRGRD